MGLITILMLPFGFVNKYQGCTLGASSDGAKAEEACRKGVTEVIEHARRKATHPKSWKLAYIHLMGVGIWIDLMVLY